ncbi:MAG TPA: ATP-binding cassette domain-containing protein [Aggregatilineales bacterium]|nr:ATP-binding cassette domain-containing protein [Aggregatilineales bacterium]
MIAPELTVERSREAVRHSVPIITVEKLTRRFGNFTAVNEVSFDVFEGEIFGFLGPNGAGKSTTIKVLCTLLAPTAGKVRVADYDVTAQPDAVRSSIGIVFQDNSLDSGLTAQENLEFHCMMYRIPRRERAERIAYVLQLMDLTDFKGRIVKTFSGGMRRRLEIARGLLHEPHLLILDEPTVGLDPQTRSYIWQYVRQLRERHNTTIFMTTHYMDEAENCDRVAIIDHGQIVALDTPDNLKKQIGDDEIEITTRDSITLARAIRDTYHYEATVEGNSVIFQAEGSERFVPRLLGELPEIAPSVAVDTLQVRKPSLEDVFLKMTGRSIRDEEGNKDQARLVLRQRGRL